jgi:hypothetical protein
MAAAVKLVYHQATFDLLDEEPVISPSALKQIEQGEQACGAKLPASVREWYSLEGAEEKLSVRLCDSWPQPLKRVLKEFKTLHSPAQRRTLPHLRIVWGYAEADLILDGSEDPPMHEVGKERRRFSEVVRTLALEHVADTRAFSVLLAKEAGCFGPVQLDFLRERLREAPDERPWRRPHPRTGEPFLCWRYRFYNRFVSVRVIASQDAACRECRSSWAISADSAPELEERLRELWPLVGDPLQFSMAPCPDMGEEAITQLEGVVKEILERIRNKFMREFVVEVAGVRSFEAFITAFNRGFCRHVRGRWNGNWNAFNDYLSWPDEKQYRLVFRGWRRCRGLGTYNRRTLKQVCREYPNVEVIYD